MPGLRPLVAGLFEVSLYVGIVLVLEAMGPHAPHDGADLVGLTAAVLLGIGVAGAARRGRKSG